MKIIGRTPKNLLRRETRRKAVLSPLSLARTKEAKEQNGQVTA
jgi:hypothetical protein